MLKYVLCFSAYTLFCYGCGPLMKVKYEKSRKRLERIQDIIQYVFIAPVQPGDDYSEYDLNRYKNCHYVGLFRGIPYL